MMSVNAESAVQGGLPNDQDGGDGKDERSEETPERLMHRPDEGKGCN